MENKKSKKKVLLYYLVLAVCLLIIAAVTVTVVFTVGRNPSNLTADDTKTEIPDDGKTDDGKTPENPDDGDDTPTGGNKSFAMPIENASMTCGFELAFDKTLTRYAVHRGIDFEAKAGDKVMAVMDGTVTDVVTDHMLNENYVTISHSDGITSTYMYINAKNGLKKGDKVKKGDVIGSVATTGGMEMNEGEHLHFEMALNGRPVDPNTYLDISEK